MNVNVRGQSPFFVVFVVFKFLFLNLPQGAIGKFFFYFIVFQEQNPGARVPKPSFN